MTPVIALVVAWIAFQQYRVSRKKLQLDLYEKRYAVFRALMELLSTCLREANVSNSQLFKFLADTSEAEFLFESEVPKYLTEAYLKANALHTAASSSPAAPCPSVNNATASSKRNELCSIG